VMAQQNRKALFRMLVSFQVPAQTPVYLGHSPCSRPATATGTARPGPWTSATSTRPRHPAASR
jgi:hypothetical protein